MTGLIAAPLAVITTAVPAHAAEVDIQILATNDFHGRLLANGSEAGAAQFAGAIAQLESTNPNTIFAAAGDLIGASTFDSFIQKDRPTLQALNAAGLDVSSAGNHEFDQGYNDLINRVMAPYDATSNPYGGALWQYIAANVRKKAGGGYALPDITARTPDASDASDGGTWTTTVGGVKVGFIGGVTEELSSLVSPAGIADLQVTSIVNETNAAADRLKAEGADIVLLLVHEGAPSTKVEDASTNDNVFSRIVNGVDSDVSAIISGHTHLAYNHTINGRPVVSAGQYGTNINQLVFGVDPVTDQVTVKTNAIVPAATLTLSAPAAIAKRDEVRDTIVNPAVVKGNELGAVELGKIAGPFDRARLANNSENRGGESSLGNLVAEVQRWATAAPESGAAQIAFMNPGGLRDDMRGNPGGYPATLTYKQAANVQSFANTLVNMKLSGAAIKEVLEQQWQTNPGGAAPSRPFLRLGVSKGFYSTFDPTKPEGSRITGMWLDGKPIDLATNYSVTVNSFLASGGDNFRGFNKGTSKRDTGKVDLQAMVDYMAAFAKTPLAVNANQQQVGVTWPADKPRFYRIGQEVKVGLSSLAMTGPSDPRDLILNIKAGDTTLAPTEVDNTLGSTVSDEYGKAAVAVKLKGSTKTGEQMLTFTGPSTGTEFSLPIEVRKALGVLKVRTKPERIVKGETHTRIKIKATALGISKVKGKIKVKVAGSVYKLKLKKGRAFLRLDAFDKAGTKKIKVSYLGNRKIRGDKQVVRIKVYGS